MIQAIRIHAPGGPEVMKWEAVPRPEPGPGEALIKQEATRGLGAEVVFVGPASSERKAKAEELSEKFGYTIIPPYDDPAIIAGQGTCGLEIIEHVPLHPRTDGAG